MEAWSFLTWCRMSEVLLACEQHLQCLLQRNLAFKQSSHDLTFSSMLQVSCKLGNIFFYAASVLQAWEVQSSGTIRSDCPPGNRRQERQTKEL